MRPVNYAFEKTVTTEGLKEEEAQLAQNIVDGAYDTGLTLNDGKKTNVVIDLGKTKEINKILVAWSGIYSRSFVAEVSKDGNELYNASQEKGKKN